MGQIMKISQILNNLQFYPNQNHDLHGNSIEIEPFEGRKKIIEINRNQIDFKTNNCNLIIEKSFICFDFESVQNEEFYFRLIKMDTPKGQRFPFYLFKSLNGYPFKLNGNYSFESIIQIGDIIYLGPNKIKITIKEEILGSKDNFPPKAIVNSSLPIFIEGDTGSGKTSLAKKIHDESGLKGFFMHINVSALSSSLIESELFGYKKGSFTGADYDKFGVIEMAKFGTLFIDEIDSLSLDIQLKLLLFLDDQKIRMVGSTQEKKIQTRLIFSSGRKLEALVNEGKIRRDFYFRIKNGFNLELCSLKNDKNLIKNFIEKFCQDNNCSIDHFLFQKYLEFNWPGNYRQLKGHLEKKLVIFKNQKLTFCQLDRELFLTSDFIRSKNHLNIDSLKNIKSQYILSSLLKCDGNYKLCAKFLKTSEKTVKKYLKD